VKSLVTTGIILTRTNFGEADRIITVLTPDQGKLRLMARGVRKITSKLAGGIELFSVSDITFIRGRGEIGTLISSRLRTYYDQIVKDLDRVQLGYELIKVMNKATEDEPESDYFDLLAQGLAALNDPSINLDLIRVWFQAQLLRLGGHTPNLRTDATGQKLSVDQNYRFDLESMTFMPSGVGDFDTKAIKFLRLLFSGNRPSTLSRVDHSSSLAKNSSLLVQTMLQNHIRL